MTKIGNLPLDIVFSKQATTTTITTAKAHAYLLCYLNTFGPRESSRAL